MNEPRSQAPPADAATLRQLIMGFRVTQLIYVAAKLGLADHLEQGPQTPHALAQAVGADPQALYRLLRALASIGLFAETADGAFGLTPLAQVLQTNQAGSLRGLAILYGEEWLWQAYGHMLYSVQTGRPAAAAELSKRTKYSLSYLRRSVPGVHQAPSGRFQGPASLALSHVPARRLGAWTLHGMITSQ